MAKLVLPAFVYKQYRNSVQPSSVGVGTELMGVGTELVGVGTELQMQIVHLSKGSAGA